MLHDRCWYCHTIGIIGSACRRCSHEVGRTSRVDCRCQRCAGDCPECNGTGQRTGWFGSGFCVACDGSGRA